MREGRVRQQLARQSVGFGFANRQRKHRPKPLGNLVIGPEVALLRTDEFDQDFWSD